MIIVIDGVDEVVELDKLYFVWFFFWVMKFGLNVKFFVSSWMDLVISKELMCSSIEFYVEDYNEGDIYELIDMERDDFLLKFWKWDVDEVICDWVGWVF